MAAQQQQQEWQRGLIETSRGVQPCNFRLLKGRRFAAVTFPGGREYTYPANIILPSDCAFTLAQSQAGSRYVAGMYIWGEDGPAVTCSHPVNRSRSHRLVWTGERWECSCEYFKRFCNHRPDDMCKHGVAAELVLRGEGE
jgi:hypothetical protein